MEFYKSSLQGFCTLPPTVFCLSLTIRVLSRETTLDEASFSNFIPPFCFQTKSCLFPSLHALRALVAKHMNHQRPPPTPGHTKHCVCLLQRVKIINHCQLTKLPPRKCFPASHSLPRDGFIGKLWERSGGQNRNEASSHLL